MAKGENAASKSKRGMQWWGKRPLSGISVSQNGMKFWKRLLHKKRTCRIKEIN